MKYFWLILFFNEVCAAAPRVRLDQNKIEDFTPFTYRYELLIADNCAHCLNQLAIMRDCVKNEDVVVLLDNKTNQSEDGLKRLIRKKKIIYKTYLLDSSLKEAYSFKGVTPMLWITNNASKKSYTGVMTCENLKLNF